MPSKDGKLTPADVLKALDTHTDEHMVQPKMVYISNSTEIGTQYSKADLEALHHICRQNDLYLFLDGARMGAALTSPVNDLTLRDIAELVDVFYIGGTKAGALFGEALIICRDELKPDYRFMIKQRGAMMAKGWLLGIQFEELFQNHLFYDMAAHSNDMASILRRGIEQCGYSFISESMTNQLFYPSGCGHRSLKRGFSLFHTGTRHQRIQCDPSRHFLGHERRRLSRLRRSPSKLQNQINTCKDTTDCSIRVLYP